MIRRSDVLFVRTSFGAVLASTQGTLDLELRHLARARARGALDDAELQAAVEQARAGGARQEVSQRRSTTPRVGGPATVSGTIRWTDSAGGTHPVRGASVQIRDQETAGSVLVATVTTNNSGQYTSTFVNDDGPGEGGRDILTLVLANGTGFQIKPVVGPTHRIQSTVTNNIADNANLTINLTANNATTTTPRSRSRTRSITTARHVAVMNGTGIPTITVNFPTDQFTSLFNGTTLEILQLDRFDHDVVGHEYGHYVQSVFAITENPGGNHGPGQNAAEDLGKSDGLRLAWGEGWPTYFALTAQEQQGAAAQGIPNVGDTSYTDTEDSTLSYSLESNSGILSAGEDDELSVQRILFDLFDAADDTGDTRDVALGDQALWDLVTNANAVTLGELYTALTAGQTLAERADEGCIFETHKVAPKITAPADKSQTTSTPPAITWARNGLGPSFRNNRFTVVFYDATENQQLFVSPTVTGTSYTPSQATWNAILNDNSSRIQVVVRGGNAAAPVTGPTSSCNIELRQPK